MEHKVCFLFGHANTSSDALPDIEAAAERHYTQYGIRTFVVGNRGSFDQMAATAIKNLKRQHRDITLQLLLAYHPGERPVVMPEGFDSSYYPPLEGVPRPYAIVRANQYMVDTADTIICYVRHIGNTRNLLEYATRRDRIPIENLAQKPADLHTA